MAILARRPRPSRGAGLHDPRAHQIALSLFLDEPASSDHQLQYAFCSRSPEARHAIHISVARCRASTGVDHRHVDKKREQAGLVGRDVAPANRRPREPAAHARRRAHLDLLAVRRARPCARLLSGFTDRPNARNSSRCSTSSMRNFNDSTALLCVRRATTDLKAPCRQTLTASAAGAEAPACKISAPRRLAEVLVRAIKIGPGRPLSSSLPAPGFAAASAPSFLRHWPPWLHLAGYLLNISGAAARLLGCDQLFGSDDPSRWFGGVFAVRLVDLTLRA